MFSTSKDETVSVAVRPSDARVVWLEYRRVEGCGARGSSALDWGARPGPGVIAADLSGLGQPAWPGITHQGSKEYRQHLATAGSES